VSLAIRQIGNIENGRYIADMVGRKGRPASPAIRQIGKIENGRYGEGNGVISTCEPCRHVPSIMGVYVVAAATHRYPLPCLDALRPPDRGAVWRPLG
jgi:hypothetical protein